MNRFFVSAVPFLSLVQADDAEGVMLLQKHAGKTNLHQFPGMLDEIPAERVPPVANYIQADETQFSGTGPCDLPMKVFDTATQCASECDSQPTCGGFNIGNMQLKAPLGTPITYGCYFACMDGEPKAQTGMYTYYKVDRTTTTTTTTSSTLYIWKPQVGPGEFQCGVPESEEQVKWCCEQEPNRWPNCPVPSPEHDCRTREEWSAEKKAWCCEHQNLGCPAAVDDPHITSVSGDKFDVYKPGDHEFLVLPEGASPQNADLFISGKVKKFGERENDLWIRKLKVEGKWVQDGPYEFKTSNVPFGKKRSALIRIGASKDWKAMDNANLNSNLLVVSGVDEKAPEADFAQSVSKKIELKAGPVKVLIDYATSQKNGEDVNHLDLHLKGLKSKHMKSMGGLLAGNVAALQLKK